MTADPVTRKTDDLKVWKAGAPRGKAKAKVAELLEQAESCGSEILAVRSDMVFGSDHIRSALYHALKAFEDGRNVSPSLAMETLLYASGERQLSSAIRKMSVPEEAEDIVVAILSGAGRLQIEGSTELPPLIECGHEALLRFGISEAEISTIGDRQPTELVLERVAAVDILKK